MSFMVEAPAKTLSGLFPAAGIASGSWMKSRPEKIPELGARNATVAPLAICTFPTAPALALVRTIVTPSAPPQVVQVTVAPEATEKSPSVT